MEESITFPDTINRMLKKEQTAIGLTGNTLQWQVGQKVRLVSPYYNGEKLVVKITRIDSIKYAEVTNKDLAPCCATVDHLRSYIKGDEWEGLEWVHVAHVKLMRLKKDEDSKYEKVG